MMKRCKKCKKEFKDKERFCSDCGEKLEEYFKGIKKDFKSKKIFYIIGGIILISVIVMVVINLNPSDSQKSPCPYECCIDDDYYQIRVCQGSYDCVNNKCIKTNCPYECCLEGEYNAKSCQEGYECVSNQCKIKDSDNDGLSDIEEREIGTNPQVYDTDGDTLGDYQEYKILGTNPLKANTDGDRYDDNEDSNPLTKNTAEINILTSNKQWNWDYVNILIAIVGGGIVNPDITIAEPTVTVTITNTGTDYSSYVRFDIIFELQDEEIDRESISLNKIEIGETKTEIYNKEIKAGDIPSMLINLVIGRTTDWGIRINNLDYETF